MRYREYGLSVASVNDELLKEYKQITGSKETDLEVIKRIIKEKMLFREISCKEDIEELKTIAKNSYYSLPGEMISFFLRQQIADKIKICKNCPYLVKENCYCPILNVEVNPFFRSCGTV